MVGPCSYIGNQYLVVDIGRPKSGLRGGPVDDDGCASVDTGHCSSLRPGLVSHIPGKQFILDFENSTVRLPTVTENTEGLLFGSNFRDNQIVMDFQNSRVYMLSEKGAITNIATPSGFMAAFSGRSDIMNDIVSTEGCECERSSMNSGQQKVQEKFGRSIGKCLSHEVEMPLKSTKTKKKASKFDVLRAKRMVTSGSPCIQQNGGTQTFMLPTIQDKGMDTPYLLDGYGILGNSILFFFVDQSIIYGVSLMWIRRILQSQAMVF
ncbi:hypothetical protein Tco_0647880 [Tanacetum coccineum]